LRRNNKKAITPNQLGLSRRNFKEKDNKFLTSNGYISVDYRFVIYQNHFQKAYERKRLNKLREQAT
jgi:hypothetical protein